MKVLTLLCLGLVLFGCATAGKIGGVQIGMTRSEVVQVMGQPNSVSAIDGTEYLNYELSETNDDAQIGRTTPYYVRLVNGGVDSYGKTGDFDSTQTPTVKVETDENISVDRSQDLYTELRKLKELLDEGILSEDEYQEQKGRVLAEQ